MEGGKNESGSLQHRKRTAIPKEWVSKGWY